MSDALQTYEYTKRSVPVPPGWMIIEVSDPACNPSINALNFWNGIDQCFQDLILDSNNTAPDAFNKFWTEGTTFVVIRDPSFVAPPPPAFNQMAQLPFAAPTPTAIPQAPAIPAPVAVVPQVPLPVLPMPVAPVAQVQAAPVVPQVPVMPTNLVSFPTPMVKPSAIPALSLNQLDIPESEAPFSAADPNEVAAWWAAREGVMAQIAALDAVKAELQKKIIKVCFPDGLREGVNNCQMPDGSVLGITGVTNRTVDQALVVDAQTALQAKNGVAPTGLFKTKYDIDIRTFKALPHEDKLLLSKCITEKDGSPQFKMKPAK